MLEIFYLKCPGLYKHVAVGDFYVTICKFNKISNKSTYSCLFFSLLHHIGVCCKGDSRF